MDPDIKCDWQHLFRVVWEAEISKFLCKKNFFNLKNSNYQNISSSVVVFNYLNWFYFLFVPIKFVRCEKSYEVFIIQTYIVKIQKAFIVLIRAIYLKLNWHCLPLRWQAAYISSLHKVINGIAWLSFPLFLSWIISVHYMTVNMNTMSILKFKSETKIIWKMQ